MNEPANSNLEEIPDVSGLSVKEAVAVLDEAGFYTKTKRQIKDIPGAPVVENGQVITTNPAPGSHVPPGAQIIVYSKLNRLLALTSLLAGLIVLAAIIAIIFSLSSDPLVSEPEPEKPKAPDESQAIKKGGSGGRVGGILVSPTFFKDQVSVGSELRPVEVQNNSARTRKVNFYFIPIAGNDPGGSPELKLTQETIKEGREFVAISKSSATIKPGEKTEVRMRVKKSPGTPEYYGALLVELGREDKSPFSDPIKGGVQLSVNNIFQITAVRILQFGGGNESGFVNQVRGFQDEEQDGVGFTARVQNDGEVLAGPTGSISVFNQSGNLVERFPLEGAQGIIPGDSRETVVFERRVAKNLEPGAYTAQANVEMGGRTSQARWQFNIDENGELPTPAMIAEAQARPYRPGTEQPFNVVVEILNTGTATYSPRLDIKIVPFGQEDVIEKQNAEMGEIAPGERTRQTFSFNGIKEIGNYEFVAETRSNDGTYLGQIVTSVLVGEENFEEPGPYIKFRDWMSANPLETLLLGAALIAVLIGLGVFVWNLVSKRRQA